MMKRSLSTLLFTFLTSCLSLHAYDCCGDAVKEILLSKRQHDVSLKQAHIGSLEIDTLLLD
ncbi:MAG: hypothetical protein NWT02_03035, partial [Opitutales bacterium]|nr:hypothetical protein [Opitutales bacterium]